MATSPLWPPAEQSPADPAPDRFLEHVREDLQKTPRQLRPQYLYDDLGSALFDAICRLPWYPITRAEKRLLVARGPEIARRVGCPLTVIELGCGSGEKLELLVAAFAGRHGGLDRPVAGSAVRGPLHVALIDFSAAALERTRQALAPLGGVETACYRATYETGLERARRDWNGLDARLVLFLGSNIGNFDPPEATRFLARVRESIAAGDRLLLGVDLVKPAAVVRAAYDDPLGVTAAFNKNLLVRINRELGADFDLSAFAHHVRWNAEHARIEMHLVSLRHQVVHIPGACTLSLPAGETIWTESSYKYTEDRIVEMAGQAGFDLEETWIDQEARFALALLRVTGGGTPQSP